MLSFLHPWDYCWTCDSDTDVKIELKSISPWWKTINFYQNVLHIKTHIEKCHRKDGEQSKKHLSHKFFYMYFFLYFSLYSFLVSQDVLHIKTRRLRKEECFCNHCIATPVYLTKTILKTKSNARFNMNEADLH